MKTIGPMDVDYRIRAVAIVPELRTDGYYMPQHQKIFYGLDAATINGIQSVVFDVTDNFKGGIGRSAGSPIELERSTHYFNQRIFLHGETIQGRSDSRDVGSRDGEGSSDGVDKVEAGEGRAGGGDRGTVEEDGGDQNQTEG